MICWCMCQCLLFGSGDALFKKKNGECLMFLCSFDHMVGWERFVTCIDECRVFMLRASLSQPYGQACWDLFICSIWWFHAELCAHIYWKTRALQTWYTCLICDGTSQLQRRLIWSIQELVNGLGSSLSPLEPIYRLLLKGLASRNHVCLGPWIT